MEAQRGKFAGCSDCVADSSFHNARCSPGSEESAPRCSEKGTRHAAGASLGLEGPEGKGGDVCHVCDVCDVCHASRGAACP